MTREELDSLARPPAERWRATLDEDAPEGAVERFARIERSYANFVDGFRAWAATVHGFVLERFGLEELERIVAPDPALRAAAHLGLEASDLEVTRSSQREEMARLLAAGRRGEALALYDRVEAALCKVHDVYLDWVSGLLSEVYRRHGVDVLEQSLRYTGERTLLRWMPRDLERPPEERVRRWADLLLGNFARIRVEEDPEKFTITQDPCGTCGRQLLRGAYGPPLDLAFVQEAHPLTFGRGPVAVYRTHVAVMHYLLPVERTGVPWPVVLCPEGRAPGPCRVLLYKDPRRTPAEYGARTSGFRSAGSAG